MDEAPHAIGAHLAAKQLMSVLNSLGQSRWPNTAEERSTIRAMCWKDVFEDFENFSDESETELIGALEAHVRSNEAFYLGLD